MFKLKRGQPNPVSLSMDDICNGYRFILGREPEDEITRSKCFPYKNLDDLRLTMLQSEEFRSKYKALLPEVGEHPYGSWERATIAYIHLQKTGGTTLHALLRPHFADERACPVRDNNLHLFSVAELGRFDFFSGNFDLLSVGFIPRARVKTISLFRNPRARLISHYRFHKSHPPHGEFAGNPFVRLANELTIEEYFEHPEVRFSPEIFNHYLLAFGLSFAHARLVGSLSADKIGPQILERAKQQVRALDAIGITERFEESVRLIFDALDLPVPSSVKPVQATDDLPKFDSRFARVDRVAMSSRLANALRELTVFDDEIYGVASEEFERRLGETRATGGNSRASPLPVVS